MTLFVDASVLVAMLVGEEDGEQLSITVRDAEDPISSAVAQWEAVTALCRSYRFPTDAARQAVADVTEARPIRIVPIGEAEMALALDAYARYGKGRHPAALNMGDCFAYACAVANDARLLYKGEAFSRTDLA